MPLADISAPENGDAATLTLYLMRHGGLESEVLQHGMGLMGNTF
jgi:hypothetical protein